jgi:hypothetical protein
LEFGYVARGYLDLSGSAISGPGAVADIFPPRITISRFDSQRSRGLQVADFVVGAIQRKYELGDGRYYDMIAPAVRIERRNRFRRKGLQTPAGLFLMHLMAHIYRLGLTCALHIATVANKTIGWK